MDKLDKRAEVESYREANLTPQPNVTRNVICPTCAGKCDYVDGKGYVNQHGAYQRHY